VLGKVINAMEAREAAQKAKDLIRRKNVFESSVLPGKLADCSEEDPKKSEIFFVEGDSAGGCFSGDTKIALADGRNLTFKELVENHKNGNGAGCYTIGDDGVEIREVREPRLTRKNADVLKVILDNGEEIICTPDHLFMLRDNSYKKALELTEKDALKPFCTAEEIVLKRKVKSVVRLNKKIDVYDLEVEGTHNFALASGVFVHNSSKQARDRRTQAILPLRGKILNVEKAPMHKVLTSEEIKNIVVSIGAGFKDDFDIKKVRYHKIVIMTDADVDGAHIRTLILTLFYRYFKSVIETGYLYIARPPLYRIAKGKAVRYAYSDAQLEAFTKEMGGEVTLQRYKGLGEMNPGQLWDTTMNPETRTLRKVTIDDAMLADELFSILMGEQVEPRKAFIERHAVLAKNLDI